jgi:hypothetical protein
MTLRPGVRAGTAQDDEHGVANGGAAVSRHVVH